MCVCVCVCVCVCMCVFVCVCVCLCVTKASKQVDDRYSDARHCPIARSGTSMYVCISKYGSIKAFQDEGLLRLYYGFEGLLRLYYGPIQALLRAYKGSIKGVLRLYSGSIQALYSEQGSNVSYGCVSLPSSITYLLV